MGKEEKRRKAEIISKEKMKGLRNWQREELGNILIYIV